MASDFSSSGSDWARQILQPPHGSWPTNTSIGFPDWASATRVEDSAAAVARPPTITDRLLNMTLGLLVEGLHEANMKRGRLRRKPASPPCDSGSYAARFLLSSTIRSAVRPTSSCRWSNSVRY